MTCLNVLKTQINRKFLVQFSAPTQDISDSITALKYLNPEVSYCVIPGIQNSLVHDPQKVLVQIMPYTTNLLLDICLPYFEMDKKKGPVKHFGRYIVCNKRLVGIKIKLSENWIRSKSLKIATSDALKAFYHEQKIEDYPEQIIIGQFIVATKHFKLAPLFQSQFFFLKDTQITSNLNNYYNLGCEIFSVVNDLSQSMKNNQNTKFFQTIKRFRQSCIIIVYSGVNLVTKLNQFYKTKSYVSQANDIQKKIQITKLDNTYTQKIIVDLNQTKNNRKIRTMDSSNSQEIDIASLDCRRYKIKTTFQRIVRKIPGQQMDLQPQKQNVERENLFLLYLWYLYVNVNKKNPFVLPYPMNNKDEVLFKQIVNLSKMIDAPKNNLISFLKLDSKSKISKEFSLEGYKILLLQKLPLQLNPLHIYFPFKQRIDPISIERQKSVQGSYIYKKLLQCYGCFGQQELRLLSNQQSIQPVQAQLISRNQRFIQKILSLKSKANLELFYYLALKNYRQIQLTSNLFQDLFRILQEKIGNQFTGTSFEIVILSANVEEIREFFTEAKKKITVHQNKISLKAEEDANNQQNNGSKSRNIVKKIRTQCEIQKKRQLICHVCSCHFSRKEKQSYLKGCLRCSNFICYNCIYLRTGSYEDASLQCLVCKNNCNCQKCQLKKKIAKLNDRLNSSNTNSNINSKNSKNQWRPVQNQLQKIKSLNKIEEEKFTQQERNNFQNSQTNQMSSLKNQIAKQCIKCSFTDYYANQYRNITFQCNSCLKRCCYYCEKYQNPKRNWVLKGDLFCNVCFQEKSQVRKLNQAIEQFKNKVNALNQQIALYKRINFKFPGPIPQEPHQYQQQNQFQKGGATPIFQRGYSNNAKQSNQSPLRYQKRNSPSENGSIASFGGQTKKTNQEVKKRKNSSNSSRGSLPSKGSNSPKRQNKNLKSKQIQKNQNINNSSKGSEVSFNQKPHRQSHQLNSSKQSNSSKRSKASCKNKQRNSRQSSAQSGQYQESSSSQKGQKQVRTWKNNFHQKTDNQVSFNDTRGRGRGRGAGRGRGDHSFNQRRDNEQNNWENRKDKGVQNENNEKRWENDEKRWENRQGQNSFQRNDRWNNNGRGNKHQNYENRNENNNYGKNNDHRQNNTSHHNSDYRNQNNDYRNNKNKEDSKNEQDGQSGFLIGKPQKKAYQNEDFDY